MIVQKCTVYCTFVQSQVIRQIGTAAVWSLYCTGLQELVSLHIDTLCDGFVSFTSKRIPDAAVWLLQTVAYYRVNCSLDVEGEVRVSECVRQR